MEPRDIDLIDLGTGVIAICYVAANFTITPLFAIPAFGAWFGIKALRRSKSFELWVDKVSAVHPLLDNTIPLLLPPPKNDDTSTLDMPLQKTEKLSFIDRVTQVKDTQPNITKKLQVIDAPKQEKRTTAENMHDALSRMPKYIAYNHPKIPDSPTPMSVLVGYDPIGKQWLWADFGLRGDTIHTFIAGQTRAGKDSQIRLWFSQLTLNNNPEDLQFIIIDAKGEWTTPALKDSKHMYIPPVGGFDLKIQLDAKGKRVLKDSANERIEDALIQTIELLQDRMDAFNSVGATNLQSYISKTGKKLPILFVIVTDIGTNLEGILEQLVKFLVLKGGSLGVRAIISMQTASGEGTAWRGQMGMVMSGFQAQDSADKPNLGIPVKVMHYRPSELPSSDVIENRGLFVVRKGMNQYVVRGAHLPDDKFEEYCETVLPKKSTDDFLSSLILQAPASKPAEIITAPVKHILTKEQSIKAAQLAAQGISPSNITKMLGFTSNKRFNDMMPIVIAIHKAVVTKQAQKKGKS